MCIRLRLVATATAIACGLAAFGVTTLLPAQAARAEAEGAMRIGVASVDITPDLPIRLTGYGARDEEATEVKQPLHAKALAIDADDAPLSVLMTVDLLGVPAAVTEEVADRLHERVGLEPAQLAICATHTHNGPAVKGVAPALFGEPLPDDQQSRVEAYTAQLVDRLEQVALAAIEDRQAGRLAWGQGSVDFAVNRRRIEDGQWAGWTADADAPVDHDLPVLAVQSPEGELRAVLLNYACHCTTLVGSHNFIHGDWAGEAAARIEATHEGVTAMVAIGCGADANPEPRGELEHVAAHGQAIADEVRNVLADDLTPLTHTPRGRVERVALPFEEVSRDELAEQAEHPNYGYSRSQFLEAFDAGQELPTELSYPIQTWTFGEELAMVFLAGEVVVDYAIRLKWALDGERLWINAYANASPCYIASRRVIAEGGYEVDGSMAYYHQPGRFKPVVEDIVCEAVHAMLGPAFERSWDEAEPAELVGDNAPRMIEPADDGVLHLTADAGQPFGPRIEYMPEPEWEAFGWWTQDDYVAWEIQVAEPGTYAVQMEWSLDEPWGYRPFVLAVGEERVRGSVEPTGAWNHFRRDEIGRVTLDAGRQTLTVAPAAPFDRAGLMDLREVRLIPVE